MEKNSYAVELISVDGEFNADGLRNFRKSVELHKYGHSYAVVAIVGPQSSGKSTLLNHLFGTNFKEMNALEGRSQTTKGIWIAKADTIDPFTVVMDLEGIDGRERGEDNTTFERQSALFALAVADVLIINIWCHDIGREHGAIIPLLRSVLEVMARVLEPRKTTLLFVIRDISKTPFPQLENTLKNQITEIWEKIPKPSKHLNTSLSTFFNVEVAALHNYEVKPEKFEEDVVKLRGQISHMLSPGVRGDSPTLFPGSGFDCSNEVWVAVRNNRDLNFPDKKTMVSTFKCEELANEKLDQLKSDEQWLNLEKYVNSVDPRFWGSVYSIIQSYITEYDNESMSYEEGPKNAYRACLLSRAFEFSYPKVDSYLENLGRIVTDDFKKQFRDKRSVKRGSVDKMSRELMNLVFDQFNKKCAADDMNHDRWREKASTIHENLRVDMKDFQLQYCKDELSKQVTKYEDLFRKALQDLLQSHFQATRGFNTWATIRKILKDETDKIKNNFYVASHDFIHETSMYDSWVSQFEDFGKKVVEDKIREELEIVLSHMKNRFTAVFSYDKNSVPRVWSKKEDINVITQEALSESLKLLSAMAALRFEERNDSIENVLFSTLLNKNIGDSADPLDSNFWDGLLSTMAALRFEERNDSIENVLFSTLLNKNIGDSADPLDSNFWDGVPLDKTLLTPVKCKSLWRDFMGQTMGTITQAKSAQDQYRGRDNNVSLSSFLDCYSIMYMLCIAFCCLAWTSVVACVIGIIFMAFVFKLKKRGGAANSRRIGPYWFS